MCDTFHPLKLTRFAADLDDGEYAYSWADDSAIATTRHVT
jgi:homogentisate 1,2-dioxygenase